MSQPLLLNLRNLACGYQDQRVVQNLNLHLNAGDIGCLLGSSGCGKTTTLRAIAGFEPVHEGEISLAGDVISRAGFTLAPEKRRIGMVFQDYALFPHLSVADNIAFGIRKHPQKERVVAELLELVNLKNLGKRFPMSFPVASNNASPSPAPWRRSRSCCCWMNPFPTSMANCAASSAMKCATSSRHAALARSW